jgi:glycine/D-amino acid oxidase-like deaminating enzyme
VVIIGGGYTGISAARALARAGATAVVLERETLGWGASTRNGGFVLPGFKRELSSLIRQLGQEKAGLLFEESKKALGFLGSLIQEESIPCQYRCAGHITLAENSRQLRALAQEQRLPRPAVVCYTTLLEGIDIGAEVGSRAYCGGLLDETAASIHPARLFTGLAQSAGTSGAILIPHTEARRLDRRTGHFGVETPRGTIRASQVLVATNGYSGPVHPGFRRRVVSVGSHIIATEPLGEELCQRLIPKNRVLNDSRNLLHYFRLSEDGRMVFGGRASFRPSRGETDPAAANVLQRDMAKVFPELGRTKIEYAWSGNVALTLDQMPHVAVLDGVMCAGGYCGHGVAMAIYIGDRIGHHLAGRAELPLLAALDFPRIPLYNGHPWFLPLVGSWYRLRDWAIRRSR